MFLPKRKLVIFTSGIIANIICESFFTKLQGSPMNQILIYEARHE